MGQSCRTDRMAKGDGLCHGCLPDSKAFPRDQLYGLASQLRRAAVAIPTTLPKGKHASQPTSSIIS